MSKTNNMGNSTGMPHGKNGGQLINGTPPTSGGSAPMPPKGTSAVYGQTPNAPKGGKGSAD